MSTWDPAQYLKFADSRTRPAAELLARVPLVFPERIVDLGCGPGNSTELLKQRWPEASIRGVDNSASMLSAARKAHPDWIWETWDIASWSPEEPQDLIFSNATLHWLPDHETLLPRLVNQLGEGGVLAVQMPNNFKAHAHQLVRETAQHGPWGDLLASVEDWHPPLEPSAYYAILAPLSQWVDIWETDYTQVLDGPSAIAEWAKGSALRPFLDRLAEPMQNAFMAKYLEALAGAYPLQADGRVLFPFRRLFIVAQR